MIFSCGASSSTDTVTTSSTRATKDWPASSTSTVNTQRWGEFQGRRAEGRVLPIYWHTNNYGIGAGTGDRHLENSLYSVYGLDNWRIRNNVTLNLGLRWEVNTPRAAIDGNEVNYGLYGWADYHPERQ